MLAKIKNINVYGSLMIISVCSWMFIETSKFPERDRLWPKGIILSLLLLSILNICRSYKDKVEKTNFNVISYICIVIVYIFVSNVVGYFLSTFAFILVSLVFLNERKKIKLILLPTLTPLAIYLIFKLFLQVPLPHGIVF